MIWVFIHSALRNEEKMPKRIQDVRGSAIRETRKEMREHGMLSVTMRSVAAACGIGLGTLYNYFSSKDMLVASAMLEDWQGCLKAVEQKARSATELRQIYTAIYEQIMVFTDLYSNEWNEYRPSNQTEAFLMEKHKQLIGQLTDLMAPEVMRITGDGQELYCRAAVELILLKCKHVGRDGFEEIMPVLEKLLS